MTDSYRDRLIEASYNTGNTDRGGSEEIVDAILAVCARDREVLIDALRSLEIHLAAPHEKHGEACGVDACVLCLAHQTAVNALREVGAFRGQTEVGE